MSRPTWEQYFISIAEVVASRSKDPRTKVGAIVVDELNHIIATGYNGMIPGVDESGLWDDKYPWVIHAEANALMHATKSVRGGTLYCTLEPCRECMKLITAAGIRKIRYKNERLDVGSREMARLARIDMGGL